jgi:hypothetical protein
LRFEEWFVTAISPATGKVAHAFPGCVKNGVRDGWRDPNQSKFADPFCTQRVDVTIVLFDKDRIEIGDIGVYRREIVRQIGIHNPSTRPICDRIRRGLRVGPR